MTGATIGRRLAKLEAKKRHVLDSQAHEQAAERARRWVETILVTYPPPAWCDPGKRSQVELIASSTHVHAELRRYFQRMAGEKGMRGSLANGILRIASRIGSAKAASVSPTSAEVPRVT